MSGIRHVSQVRIWGIPIENGSFIQIERFAVVYDAVPESGGRGNDHILPSCGDLRKIGVCFRVGAFPDIQDVDPDHRRFFIRVGIQTGHHVRHDIPGPGHGAKLFYSALVHADHYDLAIRHTRTLIQKIGYASVHTGENAGPGDQAQNRCDKHRYTDLQPSRLLHVCPPWLAVSV